MALKPSSSRVPVTSQPVSSAVSRAAASTAVSFGSTRPAGTSQPQVSGTTRCRHSNSTAVAAPSPRSTTQAAAWAVERMAWCS